MKPKIVVLQGGKATSKPKKRSCFWRHDWDIWKTIDTGEIFRVHYATGHRGVVGNYLLQQRVCKTCGKVELDQQRVDIRRV